MPALFVWFFGARGGARQPRAAKMCALMRDDEFERLYEAEAQALFGFLAYRTGDRALAEDLLADTFERALRVAPALRPAPRLGQDVAVRDRAEPAARPRARAAAAEGRALERAGPRRAGGAEPATRSSTATSSSARSPRSARRSARRSRCASAPS